MAKQRIALVTGAAQGIGSGIARQLAATGHYVVLGDINLEGVQQVAQEIQAQGGQAEACHCDISNRESLPQLIEQIVERHGELHVLVNNAYLAGRSGPLESKAVADFELALQGNLYAPLLAMQKAFPIMQKQQFGRIINLCSLNGVNAHMYSSDYNVGKEALRCLTRSAAREWAPYGITVNAICPGAKTPAYERFAAMAPEAAARMLSQNPMGRMGDVDSDIGSVVVFLASDGAGYLTGDTLFLDGGSHINGVSWNTTA